MTFYGYLPHIINHTLDLVHLTRLDKVNDHDILLTIN